MYQLTEIETITKSRYTQLKAELSEVRYQYDAGLVTYQELILKCHDAIQHFEQVEYVECVKGAISDYDRLTRLAFIVKSVSRKINRLEINTTY